MPLDRDQLISLLPIVAALAKGGAAGAGGFAQGWTQGRTYLDEQKRRDEAIARQQQEQQVALQRQQAMDQERRQKDATDLLFKLGPMLGDRVLSQMDATPGLDPTETAGREAQMFSDLLKRIYPDANVQ